MLISADASACHRTCIRLKLAAVDIEAALVFREGDNEVRCTLLQRLNVDRLVKRRAIINSTHLLRWSNRTGLHYVCQHHPRIGIAVRTGIHTKRAKSTMCSRRWTGDDSFEPSGRCQQ